MIYYGSYIRLFPHFHQRKGVLSMGKHLKGKECGKALSQRKDKKYSPRYVTRLGKRIEKYFGTLPEARNWLADVRYEDMHSGLGPTSTMTVDSWFNY